MPTVDTDRDWEHFGKTDPYWAVYTEERFRRDRLTAEARREFFETGERYVDFIFRIVRQHIAPGFAPASALDFGCGVGRVVIPLARRCTSVVGLDVSEGMLTEARATTEALGLSNVRLARSDDQLRQADGPFDLINSYIVLQHIPTERGEVIAQGLVERLNEGGVGVLHFLYAKDPPPPPRHPRLRAALQRCGLYPVVRAVRHPRQWLDRFLPRRRPEEKPIIQMNVYNLSVVFAGLQRAGVRRLHVEFTDHGGGYGAILFFQKERTGRYST